jgi:hypothetical protein
MVYDMDSESRKTVGKSLATVILSGLVGFSLARFSGFFQGQYDVHVGTTLSLILVALILYLAFFDRIEDFFWALLKKRSLKRKTIAIIRQEGCPRAFTRFTPDDWRQRFDSLGRQHNLKIEIIGPKQISGKYVAIVNPYGEYYPEEDLVELKTLKSIKKYVFNGGVFVNVGGIAFFYGYDAVRRREATLAKELDIYVEQMLGQQRVLMPSRLWPNYVYSLIETPLADFFKVVTTSGNPQDLQVFQEDVDRRFVGDIKDMGGTDHIEEFRAAREPLRSGQPLLRSRLLSDKIQIIIYPLIAIPHNKGCLILGGVNLDSHRMHNNIDVDKAEQDKIIQALINLFENQLRGSIPLDWRKPVS